MSTSTLSPVAVKIEPVVKEREAKREAFRQDAITARDAYRLTGMHVTMAEADAWMAKLEAGHDVEPPECHD